jgi:hypothetical protein
MMIIINRLCCENWLTTQRSMWRLGNWEQL